MLESEPRRSAPSIAHALEQLDPKRTMKTVMIGDRKHDIIGAQEMGIDSVGVLWGYGSRAELEAAKATMIVETIPELSMMFR